MPFLSQVLTTVVAHYHNIPMCSVIILELLFRLLPSLHPESVLIVSPSGACRVARISCNVLSTASSINGPGKSSDVI